MRAFLDTSVLLAAFYGDHPHHHPSIELLACYGRNDACCAAHSLAEVYAVLTGMPGARRVSGDEALLYLGSIRENLMLVTLNEQEYFQSLENSAKVRIAGGTIYDSLLGHCALKVKAKTLYTWNTQDYLRLPAEIASLVRTPI